MQTTTIADEVTFIEFCISYCKVIATRDSSDRSDDRCHQAIDIAQRSALVGVMYELAIVFCIQHIRWPIEVRSDRFRLRNVADRGAIESTEG